MSQPLHSYAVWDGPTRVLHWLNAVLVLPVIGMGLLFMFRKELQIEGPAPKLSIMETHSLLGYALALGVGLRVVWGFFGNRHVRHRAILPTSTTPAEAVREAAAIVGKEPYRHELGHGALGKLSTTAMLSLFLLMFTSGTLQAALDLRHPPLWGMIASYVAKPGADPAKVELKSTELVDASRVAKVRRARTIAVKTHSLAANALMALLCLHVVGVLLKESRHGGGLLSSMLTGKKVFTSPPTDAD